MDKIPSSLSSCYFLVYVWVFEKKAFNLEIQFNFSPFLWFIETSFLSFHIFYYSHKKHKCKSLFIIAWKISFSELKKFNQFILIFRALSISFHSTTIHNYFLKIKSKFSTLLSHIVISKHCKSYCNKSTLILN